MNIKNQKKWGHDELANDLAASLEIPERMVWTDMQLGPSGSSRPDVFTMQKSYSRPLPKSYEIKVSISDFRSDITSGKWQKYLKFSACVIFAVPKGLITKDDVPIGCGLMTRGENGWRTIKKPTMQVVELPEHMMLKLLIDGIERARRPKPAEWNQYVTYKKLKKLFSEDVNAAIKDLNLARGRLANIDSEADRIISLAKTRAELIEKDSKELREKHISVFGKVCRALKMDKVTSNEWQIQMRVEKIIEMANQNEVIQRSRRAVANSISTLQRELDAMPSIEKDEAA
jgi:hypothetical protein